MHPETLFNLLAWAATALSSVAGLLAYARLRRELRPVVPAAGSALVIVGICCLIACGVLGAFGGFFGLIKVVQYHLALPTLALALMVGAELVRGERSRAVIALGLALALPAPVIAHAPDMTKPVLLDPSLAVPHGTIGSNSS